jgi:hypothetical protein
MYLQTLDDFATVAATVADHVQTRTLKELLYD